MRRRQRLVRRRELAAQRLRLGAGGGGRERRRRAPPRGAGGVADGALRKSIAAASLGGGVAVDRGAGDRRAGVRAICAAGSAGDAGADASSGSDAGVGGCTCGVPSRLLSSSVALAVDASACSRRPTAWLAATAASCSPLAMAEVSHDVMRAKTSQRDFTAASSSLRVFLADVRRRTPTRRRPAAAGPSNIDDPLEREKWIEEAIENDPVLVRRVRRRATAKMAQVQPSCARPNARVDGAAGCRCQFPQRGCEARFRHWPPEKQRALACFSRCRRRARRGGGRAAPCWRPACRSPDGELADAVEASVRIHHFGWHTFRAVESARRRHVRVSVGARIPA